MKRDGSLRVRLDGSRRGSSDTGGFLAAGWSCGASNTGGAVRDGCDSFLRCATFRRYVAADSSDLITASGPFRLTTVYGEASYGVASLFGISCRFATTVSPT